MVKTFSYKVEDIIFFKWIGDSLSILTNWNWVTHISVGKLTIVGSNNGLLLVQHQVIIWASAEILLIGPLGTNFNQNTKLFIQENASESIVCEMVAILSKGRWVNYNHLI